MLVSDNYAPNLGRKTGKRRERSGCSADGEDGEGSVSRRNVMLALMLVVLAALVAGIVLRTLSGPPAGRLIVAGDVRVQTRTVVAPAIQYPTMSYTVTVPSNATSNTITLVQNITTAPRFSLVTSPAIAVISTQTTPGQPVTSGRLVAVNVRVGDHVTTGTVIAQLDTKLLDLGVTSAKLSAERTRINVDVLNSRLDDLADAQNTLNSARSQAFATAFAQIDAAIATALQPLYAQHAAAVAALPKLETAVAGLQAALSHLPPGSPAYNAAKAQLAKLQPQLMQLQAFLKMWPTIEKKALAGAATGRAKGVAAASTAINTAIGSAQSQLDDAKKKIKDARSVLKIIRDGAGVGVTVAEIRRSQATIVSPCSGTVIQTSYANTAAMVGAPLVRIQPDTPTLVDTYLTADQLGQVRIGTVADITYDSGAGSVRGVLSAIDAGAPYPPTTFPTDIVHMTHAVRVTFQLDSGNNPPAGTPVDISIHTD
jgi:multidrug resistance efflux pump